ncbi:SUMF1/EgtB/PvdO family nonheme iron enzyme [Candidatus Latescibacterota bacterium]
MKVIILTFCIIFGIVQFVNAQINGKIAFTSDRDGNDEIYVMNPDGSDQRNITNNPASDGAPSWSPDGSQIAFASNRDGVGDIYVMNADGSNQKRLTNNPANDYNPTWSPDSSQIAFHSHRDGNGEIYVMNTDGFNQINVSNNPADDFVPSWSPDCSQIAFHSQRDSNAEIYIMNADSSNQRNVSNNSADDFVPSWSPDGSQIVFQSNRNGNFEIYVMNADGSNQINVTNNPALDGTPSWSITPSAYSPPEMVSIPAGNFQMGSTTGEAYEQPVHTVTLSAFEMSTTEITQGQYTAIMGSNPSYFTGDDNLPVEMVDWYDAVKFCNRLSDRVGLEQCYDESTWECDFSKTGFRLPTEAEWEYACRAGTTTKYYTGDTESDLARAGWYSGNSGSKAHPVGQKESNAWGLYDMHGNIWEWCHDWYDSEYYTKSPTNNPTGIQSGLYRVNRGGRWDYSAGGCRSAMRAGHDPNLKHNTLGFRIVRRATLIKNVELISPNGGENWEAGTEQDITWTSLGISIVKIEFSVDNGLSWYTIADNVDASTGLYSWIVPKINSTECLVKISDINGTGLEDTSDNLFTFEYSITSDFEIILDETNASKWFGGDDRQESKPRNVGAGQSIILQKNSTINSIGFKFAELFDFYQNPGGVGHEVTLVLNVRTDDGTIIDTIEKTLSSNFSGGWVIFHCDRDLIGNQEYIFTCSVKNGEVLEYQTNILAHTEDMLPNSTGYTGEINIAGGNLDDWSNWEIHPWDFNFRLTGSYSGGDESTLQLISPNGGENWEAGSVQNITWEKSNIDRVMLMFSSDNGANWNIIAENVDANAGSFSWTVPEIESSQCLVKITDDFDTDVADVSDSVFTIEPKVGVITLISPNGGESWGLDTVQNITWAQTMMDSVMIQFSVDNGANWEIIVENYDAKAGSYSWRVPLINSTESLIKISDNVDTNISDVSDGTFTIEQTKGGTITLTAPNGGETVEPGSNYNITWTTEGVYMVDIEFSITNGNTWEAVQSGVSAKQNIYYWTVPEVSSTECLIRIVDHTDDMLYDASDNPFAVTIEKSITLLSPNGGEKWPSNSTQTIQWSNSNIDNVTIEYSPDGGITWINVVSGADASAGAYEWTIPEETTAQCKIRISDYADFKIMDESDGVFEITSDDYIDIAAPGPGDIWTVNSEKKIRWEFSGIENVRIELSIDDGVTWDELTGNVPALTGSYSFTVPDTPSNQCRVRISDISNPEITDTSERFEINRPELSIYHNPISEAEELQALDFTASVTTSSEIDSVMFYYRKAGDVVFDHQEKMNLINVDTNEYGFTLETGYFTAPGLEYYIIARDVNDVEARSPVDVGFYTINTRVLDIMSTELTEGGTLQNAYRMISIPLNLSHTTIDEQLMGILPPGGSGTDWRLFRYPPGISTPDEYPNIEGFSPGNAFWLITKNDFRLKASEGTTVTTSESFNITLKQGWNDIANPWMFDISWDTIENPSGANLSPLYTYEGSWSDPTSPPTIMEPWKGYAVYSYSNMNVVIKLQPEPDDNAEKLLVNNEDILWMLTIEASAGEAKDTANHFGVREDASTEWDQYDHAEPPPVGEYVSVAFPHNEWEQYPYDYTVDFRPPESTISWYFNVKTNILQETVVVQFSGTEHLPGEYSVEIYDLDMENILDDEYNSFSFVSGKSLTERHFKLVVSSSQEPEPEEHISKPERFVIANCYPNPFNTQTTIQYELSKPGKVTISIFNVVGQQVQVHDAGYKDKGTYEFMFDASSLTTGIYFYRVDGGYGSVTGKMLYMK